MTLRKRPLITDDLELREYDGLATLVHAVKDAGQPTVDMQEHVHVLAWQRFDALRRAADMPSPPERLAHIPATRWDELREKARKAAEAYEELLDALDRP